jgi:glycosyltransferase involved in cell wall biosynthesis
VVGWTGSSTSQTHLEAFESVLEELLKVRDVEIRVISNREPAFTRIPFTWRPWNLATEIEEISEFDIGIMPLPDDDWSRGKCSFKALQCMSLGIPTVCSDVGANREVVDHDLNGFLAVTPADWIEYLTRFIDNADLRDKMGAQARNKVVSGYSLERSAALFAEAIIRAIDIRRNES